MAKIKNGFNLSLFDIAVFFYIFSIILANGTIIFYIASAAVVLCGFLRIGRSRFKLPVNKYIIGMFLFIVYCFFQIALGIAEYPEVSTQRLGIIALNFVITVVLFVYLLENENRSKAAKCFIISGIFLIFYGLITNFSGILSGRFGDTTNYLFGLNGVNGLYMNSNDVGRVMYVSLLMLTSWGCNNYIPKLKKSIFTIVFIGFAALTGSRTALLIAVVYVLLYYFMSSDSTAKKFSAFFYGIIGIVLVYFLIMNVSSLYLIIGQRIEILFTDSFKQRDLFSSMDGNSTFYRIMMLQQAYSAFVQKPLFGWGLFAYSQMDTVGTYSHSNVMEMLVSGGITGFIIYYFGLFWILKASIKNVAFHRKEAISFSVFLSLVLIMNMVAIDFINRIALFEYVFIAAAISDWKRCANHNTKDFAQ